MVVDVWWVDVVALGDTRLAGLSACLTEEERARAGRFLQGRDRVRFAVCRAALRHIVGRASGVPPADLQFQTGSHGKPFVEPLRSGGAVEFNLSHSGDWGVIAVAPCAVGVDVERVRATRDLDAIMRRFFAESEVRVIEPLAGEARVAAFYRVWTRKEAYMKATGAGLSMGTSTFAVATGPEPAPLGEWTFANLAGGPPGYAASLALRGPVSRVEERRFAID